MDSGCRESDTLRNLPVREFLRNTAEFFLHIFQVTLTLLDGKERLFRFLMLGLFRFLSQSDCLSRLLERTTEIASPTSWRKRSLDYRRRLASPENNSTVSKLHQSAPRPPTYDESPEEFRVCCDN